MDNSLSARRDILTETKSLLILSKFPGTDLALQDDGKYAITSVDPSFNVEDIDISELIASAKSVVSELQERFGPGGERLGQIETSYLIATRPV